MHDTLDIADSLILERNKDNYIQNQYVENFLYFRTLIKERLFYET